MANMRPVCGFTGLKEPAYRGQYRGGIGSLEICNACGFQFGFTDDSNHITHEQWRQKWIDGGMVWDKGRSPPPINWNPQKQLLSIGVKV